MVQRGILQGKIVHKINIKRRISCETKINDVRFSVDIINMVAVDVLQITMRQRQPLRFLIQRRHIPGELFARLPQFRQK